MLSSQILSGSGGTAQGISMSILGANRFALIRMGWETVLGQKCNQFHTIRNHLARD
jgi:hypothetical protein